MSRTLALPKAQALQSSVQQSQFVQTARAVAAKVSEHDITGLAAELSYRGLLAIFPFFIFLGALAGYIAVWFHVDNPAARIIQRTGDALPPDAASVLQKQLSGILEAQHPGLLSFGLIGALLGASAAMNTIIKALNRIYGVQETRPFWRKMLLSLGLTALAGIAIVGGFALHVIGQVFGKDIADQVGLSHAYWTLVNLARWPFVFLIIMSAATIVYRYAPARRLKLPWTSAGAFFFTIAWTIATYLFGLYLAHSRSYEVSYGALAGVVILMVWFYLTALLFLVGAEINRLLERELDLPAEAANRA